MKRRPLRKFPDEWFSTEVVVATGGSEPREVGFSRSAHAQELLAGIRQAYLSKPKNPVVRDQHVYFAARTWKDRPSLRRNLENINARIHRVLPDGSVVGSWASKLDYDQSKAYVGEYQRKQSKAADLDFIESIKGLDPKDKLGRSLLEVLEEQDVHREGQLSVVFYPDYSETAARAIVEAIESGFRDRGLKLEKIINGIGRVTALFRGPLHLSDEIADRVEAIAVVEQVGELRPAGPVGSGVASGQLQIAIRPQLPEVAVLDTGVAGKHPMLQGVVLSGEPAVDLVDVEPDGGHGTFVAGIIAYGEDPEAQISNKHLRPRALVHSRRVTFSNVQGGMNLDNYDELAKTVEALRKRTRVFTASLSQRIPIDSDSISSVALNIDLVCERYGVLFVLPMGNLPNVIDGQMSPSQPNYGDIPSWCTDANARMGRPGESFNALTVSSLAERQVGNEWSTPGEIAAYSRRGPGPKGYPKPDLAAAGGNCILAMDPTDSFVADFDVDTHPQASITGLAAPKGTTKLYGTSFAVPKIAFALAKLVTKFETLVDREAAPLMAKGYLIHICQLPEGFGPLPEDEEKSNAHLLYGHGVPSQDALEGVLPSELCFYATEEIGRRQRHVYSLKFPANILNKLPEVLLRVTIAYFARVDASALDAELYSLIDITAVVRWGGKTLNKIPRGGPLSEFYPIKSFEVKFAKPREGDAVDRGQPTIEVLLKDRVLDADTLKRRYALLISLVSPAGEILLNDLVQELEPSE